MINAIGEPNSTQVIKYQSRNTLNIIDFNENKRAELAKQVTQHRTCARSISTEKKLTSCNTGSKTQNAVSHAKLTRPNGSMCLIKK